MTNGAATKRLGGAPLNIHEYQAKRLLSGYGVPVPKGAVAYTPDEAENVAQHLGGTSWVVKAQVLAGDRGRAGGVRIVDSFSSVRRAADELLGKRLVTPQTGSAGELVKRVYIEPGYAIRREIYLGAVVDRARARVTLIAATEGGTAIEDIARESPASVHRVVVDPVDGLQVGQARELAAAVGLTGAQGEQAADILQGIYRAFVELDASLVEINPLVVTSAGEVVALDAKMSFDENALFRHKDVQALRDEDDPDRLERARHGFNYLKLDGDIGCMVNGAGLAMATMDMLRLCGGRPANFLDIPPGASREQVIAAFRLILSDPGVKVILVNVIGGGITRCDAVAEGMAGAVHALGRQVPMVVRFEGTNRDLGKKTLRDTGISFEAADTLADAARMAAEKAAGGR